MDSPSSHTQTSPPLPPGIGSPTPPTTAPSLPILLVPKPEPLDELFATPQHSSDHQHHLCSEFNRVSQLFRVAFAKTSPGAKVTAPPDPFPPTVSQPDPGPEYANTGVSCSHSQPINVSDPNSRAIVPVPPQRRERTVAVARSRQGRRKELVRVADLSAKELMHFREVMRRTRLTYDSIRVWTFLEEEKRVAEAATMAEAATLAAESDEDKRPRRLRGDLRAAARMKERGLWLNRDKRIVGALPGVMVGDLFLFRIELCVVGLHGQIQAGIDYLPGSMSSNGEPIATSVIVSGGYEDDKDDGEVIHYTGHGGQDKNSSRQISDQRLEAGNLALERSMHYGIEVRVIRGMKYEGSASASGKVYVYDGLYRIVDCWFEVGRSGFGVYKYKLYRIVGQSKMGSAVLRDAKNIRSGLEFDPLSCLCTDLSNEKESVAVRLFNDIDDNKDPLSFEYLATISFPQFVFHQYGKATGCDCVDGCGDGCFCAIKNGGDFPYSLQGFLLRGKPLIFECGPFCSCPPHCRNRLTQRGLKNKLEVFRSQLKSWGVRSLDLIQAGSFICEYTGVVLTRAQAQILTMYGDSLIYPNRFSERWAEWGDLSPIYPDYVRPSYPSVPPLDFYLDVSTMRNVACYISHSSTPNVMVQFVLYDHNNLTFPHLMLFAMENIPPMRELSLDYGVADESTGKLAICN
ncbi:histone-lysine N-methyltransferase family member SUVH9-like [Abrus precatorius]|uniref:Histone-lysine N-methyltransferase family member SUVH9-like n=1 Tax=Abrus precatorius TaxID=3816 RepID=A0A8B8KR71_ABRPR|nr:histone-lysine N-methyltransferase family member SUVH9-like [Abrus precatorius]